MKFLLDMNLPRSLGRKLQVLNHETRHVGDLGMAEAIEQPLQNGALIVIGDQKIRIRVLPIR